MPEPRPTSAAPAVRAPRGDLPGLTSLRFVAAALVLLHHAAGAFGLPYGLGALGNVGFVGVDFFFVLSGFVLTWSHRDGQTAGTFWRHRFVRVYPLHLVGWLAAIVLVVFLTTTGRSENTSPIVAYVLALVLLQAWVPVSEWAYAANGVSWSLACEAVFYALFPALHPRIARLDRPALRRVGFAVFGAMVLAVVVVRVWNPELDQHNPGVLYTQPLYRLGEFVLGIVLARAVMAGWRPRIAVRPALVLALVAYLALAVLFSRVTADLPRLSNPAATREIGGLLVVPVVALVLAATAVADHDGRSPRWLAARWAVLLGRWSFAFYVVHQLVVNFLASVLPTPTAASQLLATAVAAVVSTALAAALHHGVEVPLVRRFRGSPPPAAVT